MPALFSELKHHVCVALLLTLISGKTHSPARCSQLLPDRRLLGGLCTDRCAILQNAMEINQEYKKEKKIVCDWEPCLMKHHVSFSFDSTPATLEKNIVFHEIAVNTFNKTLHQNTNKIN